MLSTQSVEKILKIEGKAIKSEFEKRNDERCIHRHTRESHPSCFRKGALARQFWYKNLKMGFLDIETTDFKANKAFILSWAIKEREGPVVFDVVNRKEIFDFDFDKRVTKNLVDEINKYDILVTYYGTGFDVPFMRTRSLLWEYDFPVYGQVYHFDLYYRVRNLLQLHRNSLDAATRFFEIEGKNHLDIDTWHKAAYGHKASLAYVLDHNVNDVIILEGLFDKLEVYSKWAKRSL